MWDVPRDFIVAEWSRDFESGDDYLLINRMKYLATVQEEGKFEPYDTDGEVYHKLVLKRPSTGDEEEGYLRLLTGYAIVRYIGEQLQCQACVADVT